MITDQYCRINQRSDPNLIFENNDCPGYTILFIDNTKSQLLMTYYTIPNDAIFLPNNFRYSEKTWLIKEVKSFHIHF